MAVLSLEKSLEFLHYLVDLEELPDEEIDGVTCAHYRGRVDQDAHTDVAVQRYEEECGQVPEEARYLLELSRRHATDVEVWIDEHSYIRLLTVEWRGPIADSGAGEETWASSRSISHFFAFNEPVVIEPPEVEAD